MKPSPLARGTPAVVSRGSVAYAEVGIEGPIFQMVPIGRIRDVDVSRRVKG
jgi:hypothetical protein